MTEIVYAPIIIPTLNRYQHLKRCVDSLALSKYAEKTELIIGLDYPPSEKYFSGYNKLRDYLTSITGFAKVTVLTAKKNYGAIANIDRLMQYVRDRGYDRFVFTEDDNEFSPNFLEFINKGLELYKNDNKIKAICGYTYLGVNASDYKSNVVAFKEFTAWGYGQWIEKEFHYQRCEKAEEYRDLILGSWKLSMKLWTKRSRTLNDLLSMFFRETTYGDSLCDTELVIDDKYCVYPVVSMVRNWGHDGSGEHCSTTDTFVNQRIDTESFFDYGELEYSTITPSGYVLGTHLADAIVLRTVTAIRYIGYRLFKKDFFSFRFNKK